MRWTLLILFACTNSETDQESESIPEAVAYPISAAHVLIDADDPLILEWVAEGGDTPQDIGPMSYLWIENTQITLGLDAEPEIAFRLLDSGDDELLNFERTLDLEQHPSVYFMGKIGDSGATAPQEVWHVLDRNPADSDKVRVQVIHGSVAASTSWDLYLGTELIASNLGFTELSLAIQVPAADDFIGVAAGGTPDFGTPGNNPIYIGDMGVTNGKTYSLTLIDPLGSGSSQAGVAVAELVAAD